MEQIKIILFSRFRIVFLVASLTCLSLLLLMVRLKLTQSYFFLFLVWNLFLAAIPFLISFYLSSRKKIRTYALIIWFGVWLLFLPNAPYIVTDFIHLQHFKANIVWLDFLLISTYAISGLVFYYLSVRDMEAILKQRFPFKNIKYLLWTIPFLVGFGIYLGRFLRWNSWDILQRPTIIFVDIWDIITSPMEHKLAWLVTFLFGFGLSFLYSRFKRIQFLN